MREVTITFKVYKFEELSAEAKDQVKRYHAEDWGYTWSADALKSIYELAKHFGGRVGMYEIDWFDNMHSFMNFEMPNDMELEEIERRLAELGSFNEETGKGHGDCVLTGVCTDESAIDGLRIAWREGERDLEALMDAAYESWIKDAHDDCQAQYEDETFAEHCGANDYEFTADGAIYHEKRKGAKT